MSNVFVEAAMTPENLGGGGPTPPDIQRWQIPVVQHSPTESLLKHTEDQISDLRQTTYQEAFQQGLAEGIKNGEQQCQQQVEQLQVLINAMVSPLQVIDKDVVESLSVLVKDMVTAITLNHLQSQPECICQIVEQSIALLDDTDKTLVLHLNPEDVQLLHAYTHDTSAVKNWKIQSNAEMQRGDVHIQSGHQFIKESLAERIQRITDHVMAENHNDEEL